MANVNLYRVSVPEGGYSKVSWIECEGYYGPTQYLQNALRSIDFQAQNNSVSASSAATIAVLGYCNDDCSGCYLIGETTTTSTTIPPVNFTLTPTCEGTGINGTGKITVNSFSGGNGTYSSIAIGASAGAALSATPISLSGASTYDFTGVFNGTWFIILRDSSGAYTTKSTSVSCTNTTTTTSTSTTSTTTSTTSTTSTTTAAINCNFSGGTAVVVYPTTSTTSTSTTSTSTSTSTTTAAPTSTTTTLGYTTFSLTYSNTSGETACTDYANPTNRNFYYAGPGATLGTGTVLYTTSALTTPVANGYYSNGVNYWNTAASVGNLQNETSCSSTTTTTTTTTSGTVLYVYAKYINSNGDLQYSINSGANTNIGSLTTSCNYITAISCTVGDEITFSNPSALVIASSTSVCHDGPGGFGCSTGYSVLSSGAQNVYITIDGSNGC